MPNRGYVASNQNHLEALRKKHALLSSQIENEQRKPSATDFYLRQLKKQKLVLKEQIEGIRRGEGEAATG